MDNNLALTYATATMTSLAAVATVAVGKKAKPAASVLAIIAGLLPWVYFLIDWLRPPSGFVVVFLAGLLGSAPLFMAALLVFGFRKRPEEWKTLIAACTMGICAGLGYSYSLYELLRKMP